MAHIRKVFLAIFCLHAFSCLIGTSTTQVFGDPRQAAWDAIGELFSRFGDAEELSLDDFKTILSKMGLQGMYVDGHGHDHKGHDHEHHDHEGHDHEHHDHEGHDHEHHDHEGHDHEHHDHEGHEHEDHNHEGHEHAHGDHGHEGHAHRRKRAAENSTVAPLVEKCPSVDDLLYELYLEDITGFNKNDFLYTCPALVNHLMSGACDVKEGGHHDHDHDHSQAEDESRNMGLVWFYLMLAVTVISLCAVWGILCIPKRSRSSYEKVIQFLMAMGAGSMAGDALLHLLPHALMPPHDHSAHGHEGHDHDSHSGHDHGDNEAHGSHEDEHMQALMKGLVALMGVYIFFALERLFSIILARSSKSGPTSNPQMHHGLHSHGEPLEDVAFISTSKSNSTNVTDISPSSLEENGKTHHWPHAHGENGNGIKLQTSDDDNEDEPKSCFPKLTPLALMIVLGDMCHNLCDGIAMGAAFSASTTIGISTSLAVFCHEFPHEVGDFAILIKSGLTKKWAILLNGASALTCYIGAVIGMFLGKSVGDAPMWIFAAVAGMFLYIALVNLIPEMTHIYLTPGKRWSVFLVVHAAGLITGSLFMLILGIYEHDITVALE